MRMTNRWWRIASLSALSMLLAVAIGCAAAPRQKPLPVGKIESGPGTVSEARKFLEGRWALESFEVRPPGKPPIMLKGSGVLNYDDFGNLRMEIRADQATSDLLRAAGIDIRDGVISTDGRTAIDLQNQHPHLLHRGPAFLESDRRRSPRPESAAALGGDCRRAHADDA